MHRMNTKEVVVSFPALSEQDKYQLYIGGGDHPDSVHNACLQCLCTLKCLLFLHLSVRSCCSPTAVFVYSMPGFKSSIKERMLYSSCKEPVVSVVEEQIGRSVDKKVFLLHEWCLVVTLLTQRELCLVFTALTHTYLEPVFLVIALAVHHLPTTVLVPTSHSHL